MFKFNVHENNIIRKANELEQRHEIRGDTALSLSPRSIGKLCLSKEQTKLWDQFTEKNSDGCLA